MIVWSRIIQLTPQYGALAIYTPISSTSNFEGKTVTIHNEQNQKFYADVSRYETEDGKPVYVAVFPALMPGNYIVEYLSSPSYSLKDLHEKKVTVFPGAVAEVKYVS